MDRKRILVVDDEEDLREILKFNLETEGFEVETASSAEQALQKELTAFDLILLDVMMEGISGFAMAKQLKEEPATKDIPIIFLTARDTENDTITGFKLGADDYISKPFSIREMLLRVKAVIRRTAHDEETVAETETEDDATMLTYEGLTVNTAEKSVSVDGEDVAFTKTEYELLHLLLRQPGRVFSREELINLVWSKDVYVLDRTVDVNITRIRKKIGPYSKCIATRLGFGYYFKK